MSELQAWRDREISTLATNDKAQILRQSKAVSSMLAAGDNSALCAKKDDVVGKLNVIANKVADQLKDLNATNAAKLEAKNAAMQAWLDTESKYRLMEEKAAQAKEGVKYASDKYEKWSEAVAATQTRYDSLSADFAKEKVAIDQEKATLTSIISLLSQLSPKDAEDAATLKVITAKVALLQKIATQAKQQNLISLVDQKLQPAHLEKLVATNEITSLIQGMVAELDQRLATSSAGLASAAEELAAHKEKLLKYQQDVVDLSNAADKARNEAIQANIERETLAGTKVSSEEDYAAESASYGLTYAPVEQEYIIIKTVVAKVEAICAA